MSFAKNHTAMASGKETREYKSVLENMAIIRDDLEVIDGAKESLIVKYMEKDWIDITEKPTAVKLPVVALNKISCDASQYHTFIDMLRSVVGMDLVVDEIEGMVDFSTLGAMVAERYFLRRIKNAWIDCVLLSRCMVS